MLNLVDIGVTRGNPNCHLIGGNFERRIYLPSFDRSDVITCQIIAV